MIIFCAVLSHTALHARGSMARGITRWFTMVTSMMTGAVLNTASTSPFSSFSVTARFDPLSG